MIRAYEMRYLTGETLQEIAEETADWLADGWVAFGGISVATIEGQSMYVQQVGGAGDIIEGGYDDEFETEWQAARFARGMYIGVAIGLGLCFVLYATVVALS